MTTATSPSGVADLLVTGAKLVATCDAVRRELPGGWMAVTRASSAGVGTAADPVPDAHGNWGLHGLAVLGRLPVPAG